MEVLAESSLIELITQRGLDVDHIASNLNRKKRRSAGKRFGVLIANGEQAVEVEVKDGCVDRFVEILQDFLDLAHRCAGASTCTERFPI